MSGLLLSVVYAPIAGRHSARIHYTQTSQASAEPPFASPHPVEINQVMVLHVKSHKTDVVKTLNVLHNTSFHYLH